MYDLNNIVAFRIDTHGRLGMVTLRKILPKKDKATG